jgi:hypothetical protein
MIQVFFVNAYFFSSIWICWATNITQLDNLYALTFVYNTLMLKVTWNLC